MKTCFSHCSNTLLEQKAENSQEIRASRAEKAEITRRKSEKTGCDWMILPAIGCKWFRLAAIACKWIRLAAIACKCNSGRGGRQDGRPSGSPQGNSRHRVCLRVTNRNRLLYVSREPAARNEKTVTKIGAESWVYGAEIGRSSRQRGVPGVLCADLHN